MTRSGEAERSVGSDGPAGDPRWTDEVRRLPGDSERGSSADLRREFANPYPQFHAKNQWMSGGVAHSDPPFRAAFGRRFQSWLPPVRLVWIALLVIGFIGAQYLNGLGLSSLVFLPLIAVLTDIVFQRVRFPHLRFPDAALTTGLFLALIFPPTAPLLLASVATFAAIAVRHVLRLRGRPWFNPAAFGALTGALLLGLAPAWWVAIGPSGEAAMLLLGALLLARNWRAWRLPLTFFIAYGALTLVQQVFVVGSAPANVLLLEAINPVMLFFGLFMVVEPRTAPAAPHDQPLFAGVVGVAAALLSMFLPALGILVALLAGNALAMVLRRSAAGATAPVARPIAPARRALKHRPGPTSVPERWPVGYRVTAGILTVVLVGAVIGTSQITFTAPVFRPGPGGGGGSAYGCQSDNPSIPATTLSALHKALGPSVILSYDSATGVVVFYDPVNHVTVTESDLYEDFGYAEFNGDDYAVSGCSA